MIECPKCHFVQPDDDFCANCGVNMKVYRQKHESSKWLKNLTPYVLTAALVGALIGFFILQFNPKNKKSEVIAAASQQAAPAARAEKKAVAEVAAAETNQEPEEITPPPSNEGNKMAVFQAQAEEKKADEKFSIDALEVYFVEISKQTLGQLSQEGTVLSDSAAATALWFPGADNKNSVLQKGQIIVSQNYRQANPSETVPLKILYQGGIKNNDEILYQMQIVPKAADANRTRLHISTAMKWLVDESDAKASTSSSFDSTYAVTGPGQLVLIGTLPQGKKPSLETRDVLTQTPLGILNSENFHKKLSELMIVVVVH